MTDVSEIIKIENLIADLEARRDELITEGGEEARWALINARLRPVFEAFLQVRNIGWVQYVPYFNDGDPCTWTINGPGINISTDEEDHEDGLGDHVDMWSFEYVFVKNADSDDEYYVNKRARYPGFDKDSAAALIEALKPIEAWLERSESYLNEWFGHALVLVGRDGTVSSEEYYHD